MTVIPPKDEDADADNLSEVATKTEDDLIELRHITTAISKADDLDEDDDNNAEEADDVGGVSLRHEPPPAATAADTSTDDPKDHDDCASSSHADDSDSPPVVVNDPIIDARDREIIASTTPTTPLEIALGNELDRRTRHNALLINEVTRLREFLSKRKQTYRRKRTDVDAPRKKLSGYNVFVRERFAALARENDEALRMGVVATTTTTTAASGGGEVVRGPELKRIPPARNITSTGKAWSMLSAEEKERYNAM
jgi:hypothetical protein